MIKDVAGPLEFDDTQAFKFEGQGYESRSIAPVRYPSHNSAAGNTSFRCGLFLRNASGKTQFVPTVGYNWTEAEQCESLQGVGFLSVKDRTPPLILMFYSASSPNASVQEPMVLEWDGTTASYTANEKLSRRLEDDDKATSIVGMKRQLRGYLQLGTAK